MVFQSMIPVGIGLMFTDWDLSGNAASRWASGSPAACSPTELHLRARFDLPAVIAWLALYAASSSSSP